MMPFERFEAWQLCHRLVLSVYKASKKFPAEERYSLTSQMRRAAFSAASKIAEGSARRGSRECRRFLDMSISSLAEVAYALILVRDLGHLSEARWVKLWALRDEAGKATWLVA